jgi:hypothetical protein
MESRKFLFRETAFVAVGQMLCTALMIFIFALLGKYDTSVLLGGIVGALIATANFFFMSLFISLAADKAEAQDIAGGQKLIQLSYMGRMVGLFLILILCAKSGIFHVLTLAIPLVFTRPILTVAELFKKKGGSSV